MSPYPSIPVWIDGQDFDLSQMSRNVNWLSDTGNWIAKASSRAGSAIGTFIRDKAGDDVYDFFMGTDVNNNDSATLDKWWDNVITVTGSTFTSADKIYRDPETQRMVQQGISTAQQIPFVRNMFALQAAFGALAPDTNSARARVAGWHESYLKDRDAHGTPDPRLYVVDAVVAIGSGAVQGGLGIPQFASDPISAGRALGKVFKHGAEVIASSTPGELKDRVINKFDSMSGPRRASAIGDILSLAIPGAGAIKLGRMGKLARVDNFVDDAAERGLAGGTFDLGVSGSQYTLRAPTLAGFEGASGTVNTRAFVVHGNSASSPRTAYLYELYQTDGTFLKNGITQNMDTRYTRGFMEDKYMIEVTSGRRSDLLLLERQRTIANPGPLNREPWAVKARGGQ